MARLGALELNCVPIANFAAPRRTLPPSLRSDATFLRHSRPHHVPSGTYFAQAHFGGKLIRQRYNRAATPHTRSDRLPAPIFALAPVIKRHPITRFDHLTVGCP